MKCNFKYFIFVIVSLFNVSKVEAQDFQFIGDNTSQSFNFKLVNNLIIIPIDVNGTTLSFIFDSGVSAAVVFNLSTADSLELKQVEKIQIRGLGTGESVDALLSKNNRFRMGNLFAVKKNLYLIYKDQFDLSAKLGVTVHGMIGYDLLKDFVVTINYITKKITFTKAANYRYKKCSKCETFDLEFYKNKPYINASVVEVNSRFSKPVKLLIDSGGTDSVWLFEDDVFHAPENSFNDFIGEGITGSIFGLRNRLESLRLKSFVVKKPNVAYLDSLSTVQAKKFESRNGSMGAEVLKRFKVVFDYPRAKLTLKKNHTFKDKFSYNMSGIELMYYGQELVRERSKAAFIVSKEDESSSTNTFLFDYNYNYEFKPVYRIAQVRKDSPAEIAGVRVGDILVKVNGIFAYNFDLQGILDKFQRKENKTIKIVVNRQGEFIKYEFKLKNLLQ